MKRGGSVFADAYHKTNLELDEVELLWQCFLEADEDGDGLISRRELEKARERIGGYYFSLRQFDELDTTKSGRVPFLVLLSSLFPNVAKSDIDRYFLRHLSAAEVLDLHNELTRVTNGTGFLTIARLRANQFKFAGYKFTLTMMQAFDPVAINFEQVLRALFPRVAAELAHCYATLEMQRSEFMKVKHGFEQADANNNGLLSYEEFEKGSRHVLLAGIRIDKPLFRSFDHDKSGQISFQELLATLFPLIPVWDIQHYIQLWNKGHMEHLVLNKQVPQQSSTTLSDAEYLYLRDLLSKLDVDGSGTLTWNEVEANKELLEEHQMLMSKEVFKKMTKFHTGNARLIDFVQHFYPNIPHRDFNRFFASSIAPDTVLHLRRGFAALAVNGKLSLSTLMAQNETIMGMNFTAHTFKCYGRETIQFVDLLKGLYKNINDETLARYAQSEITKAEFDQLREEWAKVDTNNKGYGSLQDIIARDKRSDGYLYKRITRKVFYGAHKRDGNLTFLNALQFLYPCVPHHDLVRYTKMYKAGSNVLAYLADIEQDENMQRYSLEEQEGLERDATWLQLWQTIHSDDERREMEYLDELITYFDRLQKAEDTSRWLIEKAEDHVRHHLRMKEESLAKWLSMRIWRNYIDEHTDEIADEETDERGRIEAEEHRSLRRFVVQYRESSLRIKIINQYYTELKFFDDRTPQKIMKRKQENVEVEKCERDKTIHLEDYNRELIRQLKVIDRNKMLGRSSWQAEREREATEKFVSSMKRPKEPILQTQRFFSNTHYYTNSRLPPVQLTPATSKTLMKQYNPSSASSTRPSSGSTYSGSYQHSFVPTCSQSMLNGKAVYKTVQPRLTSAGQSRRTDAKHTVGYSTLLAYPETSSHPLPKSRPSSALMQTKSGLSENSDILQRPATAQAFSCRSSNTLQQRKLPGHLL